MFAALIMIIKATEIILLLGIGCLLYHNICNLHWLRRCPRSRSAFQQHRRDSSPSLLRRSTPSAYVTNDFHREELLEDFEEGKFNEPNELSEAKRDDEQMVTSSLTASVMTGRTWEKTSSETSMPEIKLRLFNTLSPVSISESSAIGVENVSERVHLMQFSIRKGQGHTKKEKTVLKAYAAIPFLLGVQYLRRIHEDNYCAVRAAIFQVLAQAIPIPSGIEAFQYLSQALHNKKCEWLQNWTFSGWLPYVGNHVMDGIKECLQYLDSVASHLSTINGIREDDVVALLNSDPIRDLHIMEAVKLHMLHHALQLYETNARGLEVPFFAILMFARDTSETPEDFMNNHLLEVGNTVGLEQLEMFLLGYTLGVTITVVRPSAYGTEEFISSYPDYNKGKVPEIFLIAEENLHYNVLMK